MHGARIDACGECMRVHVHGGAWVNCTVWHGSPRPGAWPGAQLHACLGVHACMYAAECTRMVHAGWVGWKYCRGAGWECAAHAWSPIECIHAWGYYIIRRSARMGVSRSSAEWGGRILECEGSN